MVRSMTGGAGAGGRRRGDGRAAVPTTPKTIAGLRRAAQAAAEGLEGRRLFAGSVVINEIHYNPDIATEQVEFVELTNPGDAPVNLGGATFGGITYTFPAGTTLAPGGYVVVTQDPADFKAKFGFAALGPFAGKLSNDGEKVTVKAADGTTLDEVEYGTSFPWPIVGDSPGRSIELINPTFDNSLGGNWRSFNPTADTTLFATAGPWKYRKGTAAEAPVGSSWRDPAFNDSAWASGTGPVGYDSTIPMGTNLPDMNGNYSSVYLRKAFTVTDPAAFGSLRLEALYDDGFNVWVNGVLAQQVNSPSAEPTRTSTAPTTLELTGYSTYAISPSLLRAGTNVIAVQFLNCLLSGSSDAYFDARLIGSNGGNGPTPGRQNAVFADNVPPQMRQVANAPQQPASGQDVTVTAKVTDPQGVAAVSLSYQLVDPGNYIALEDAAYNAPANWTSVPMRDDGTGGDAAAGDGVYTAVLPGSLQTNRRLVRYRVTSTDGLGASVTGPYADDPQPNFAYYVYDGVPTWTGAVQPGTAGSNGTPVTYGPTALNSTAVYQLITKKQDHLNAQHLPGATTSAYDGDQYLWSGTFVYDGVVYDHIHYRARGGVWRYAMGKNMWKLDFNTGHELQARDAYGNPYPVKWSKLNLGANIQQGDIGARGEQGLFETLGFQLYNLAGVPGSRTLPVQLRIVENSSPTNNTASQYDDDFQGLYLAVEQDNGRFLDAHGLPDGNFYKMEPGTGAGGGSLNNQGPTQPDNNSDLAAFISTLSSNPTEQWLRDNVDLDSYYSFRAITKGIHNFDIGFGKNYFFYHNPDTNKWQIIPWDLDLTWYGTYEPGGGDSDPLESPVMRYPNLVRDYRNRVREVRDLLYNPEQVGKMADEYAALVNPAGGNPTLAQADRAMWDYNPILASGSVNPQKAGQGRYYQRGLGPAPLTFASMVAQLKAYAGTRSAYIDANVLTAADEAAAPARGTVSYTGPAGFGPAALTFATTGFTPGNAGGAFAAMEWRVADVTPTAPGRPPRYEVNAAWESGEQSAFNGAVTVPASAVAAGHTYRVRVRFKDTSGRWGHWSNVAAGASEFTVGDTGSAVRQSLRVTELNYNPPDDPVASGFAAQDYEFIEFKNVGAAAIDLTGVKFNNGVEFAFAAGTMLAPGEIGVVVKNAAAFQARYGKTPFAAARILGTIASGSFDNGGESVSIVDAGNVPIQGFAYDDDPTAGWPTTPDGGGATLVVVNPAANTDLNLAASWRAGRVALGTPGVDETAVTAPQVTTAGVSGSGWAAGYTAFLAATGHGAVGYALQPGPPLATLPWVNLDRVSLRFDHAVNPASLATATLTGTAGGKYALGTAAYDPATFTATWTLPAALKADRLWLSAPAVTDFVGNPMATYGLSFNVLPGDVTGNALTSSTDLVSVRNRQGSSVDDGAGFDWISDVNGSGLVSSTDLVAVRNLQGTVLPELPPAAAGRPTTPKGPVAPTVPSKPTLPAKPAVPAKPVTVKVPAVVVKPPAKPPAEASHSVQADLSTVQSSRAVAAPAPAAHAATAVDLEGARLPEAAAKATIVAPIPRAAVRRA